jgi:hypothetical protein
MVFENPMKRKSVLIFILILVFTQPAFAVVAAKIPVSKMYETAKSVIIARVTQANETHRVLDVETIEVLKGAAPPKLRIQIVEPKNVFDAVRIGDPVVILTGKVREADKSTIHLAGGWYVAQAKADSAPQIWQIIQPQSNDFPKGFPGSTSGLVLILREIQSKKPTYLSVADERLFNGGMEQLSQLTITPTGLFAADLNNDKSPELLISTPHGPQILAAAEGGYDFVTKKYSTPDSGTLLAVGDLNGDKESDLLIDKTPYINGGTTFKPEKALDLPARADLLAISIIDGKVITLSKAGELRIGSETKSLWTEKDSPPRLAAVIGPFGETSDTTIIALTDATLTRYTTDGQSSDFTRLTGEPLSTYLKGSGGKFKNPKLVPLDANGDGRRDLLVLSEGADFLLINRGFGAYFVSRAAAALALGSAPDMPYPFAASAATSHFAAIDTRGDKHEDLLILTPDGALYRLVNPPHAQAK